MTQKRKLRREGIVCDLCRDDAPCCEEHRALKIVRCEVTFSHGMRWEQDGNCYEQVNNSPWERRQDWDLGTPNGDLLWDPWIQDAMRKK